MLHRFVFLAAVDFNSPLAGRTRHLAEGLRDLGQAVTFVPMPSLRHALCTWWRRSQAAESGSIDLLRLAPLPWRLRRGWCEERWLNHAVSQLAKRLQTGPPAVVIASTPWWAPLSARLTKTMSPRRPRICYDWIDDLAVHAGPGETRLRAFGEWEKQMRHASDLVLAVSPALYRQALLDRPADRVALVPNAVNRSWLKARPVPISLAGLGIPAGRPIAGFLGALHEWVDIVLLAQVARRLPALQFVLVGPGRREVSLSVLESLPNVTRVGPACHADVPRWLAAFDVCLIPFRRNRVTDVADPIKVYEYCALGKPIVSTVTHQRNETPAPLAVAVTANDFADAIMHALKTDSAEKRSQRLRYASANTWDDRARRLLQCVQEHTGRRRAA